MKKRASEFGRLLRTVPPLIVSLLVLSTVGMNLLANKSIDTGLDWLALDCGILFSWLAFLSMDVATHCYGPGPPLLSFVAALGLNLLMALIFFLASRIPGVWGESFVEGSEAVINTALDNTFGGTWFIILGSSIAFLASAVLNNFLNYGIGKLLKRKRLRQLRPARLRLHLPGAVCGQPDLRPAGEQALLRLDAAAVLHLRPHRRGAPRRRSSSTTPARWRSRTPSTSTSRDDPLH